MRRPWILTPARKWTAWLILTALDVILLGVIASLWLDVRWVRVINTLLLILLGIIGIGGLAWLWWDLRPWKAGARSVTEDDERLKKEYLAAKLGEVDERILADARRWRARQADRRRRPGRVVVGGRLPVGAAGEYPAPARGDGHWLG